MKWLRKSCLISGCTRFDNALWLHIKNISVKCLLWRRYKFLLICSIRDSFLCFCLHMTAMCYLILSYFMLTITKIWAKFSSVELSWKSISAIDTCPDYGRYGLTFWECNSIYPIFFIRFCCIFVVAVSYVWLWMCVIRLRIIFRAGLLILRELVK